VSRDDNVFLFTLIDFLVQVLFFGLAFYTVIAYTTAKPQTTNTDKIDHDKVHTVTEWTWASSIPELAGTLGGLRKPQDNFSQWAEFISSHDLKDVTLDFDLVKRMGGRDRLEKAARALGKPSCLAGDAEKNTATAVADLLLTDSEIAIQSSSPTFLDIAKQLGVGASVGSRYTLSQFRAAFQGVNTSHPDCRYFVNIQEKTELIAPRNAVNSAFLVIVRK
jgi:hypothetical protein